MSSHRLREIPEHNRLKRWPKEVINLEHDQPPCKGRKTTKDQCRDHEQEEEEVILVSADGNLLLKTLLGDDKEFRAPNSTKKATTSKDGATTIEEQNHDLTIRLASLE